MVKKNIFILLLALIVFLNSPAYPKSRDISYLPSDTNMVVVRKDYAEPLELKQLDLRECSDLFKGVASCRKCAKLQKECPDCCLVEDDDGNKRTMCGKNDPEGDYDCDEPPFQTDVLQGYECSQTACGTKFGDNEDEECRDKLKCKEDGSVSSGSPYGLQRRGCPEGDSEDLAPSGNCEKVGDGEGVNREWECDKDDYSPKFSGCEPDGSSGLVKPSEYYSVVRIETICFHRCEPNECYADCPATSKGACKYSTRTCMPSCTPICEAKISSGFSSGAGAECTPSGCGVSQSCTASCIDEKDTCTAGKCSSPCGASFCKSYSSRWSSSPSTFYVYELSPEFKEYITDCTNYADVYETCEDRVTCCQKNVCPSEDKDESGFEKNCTNGNSCEERRGCINAGFCDEGVSEGKCIDNVRLAAECLVDKETDSDTANDLSLEISSDVRYEFAARSNESLTIDWQVVLEKLDSGEVEDMEGISFYTFVRVEEVGAAAGTPPVHISMLTIRDMENAFSIYGLTNVPKGRLASGKKYVVKIHYFFPKSVECKKVVELADKEDEVYVTEEVETQEVKVRQLFLNIVRIRE